VGWTLAGLWVGLGLCRELLRHNLPERSARTVARHLRIVLLLFGVFTPLHRGLLNFGYGNASVIEVVSLVFGVLLAITLASLLFRRGLLASLVPDADAGAARVASVALRILQPCLALLVPTALVLRILYFDLLAALLFRYSISFMAGALAAWIGYRAGAVLLDVLANRLFPHDEAPRRNQATREALRFVFGIAVVFVGLAVFLFVSGDTSDDMRVFFDQALPLQRADAPSPTTYWDLLVTVAIVVVFLFGTKHAKNVLHDIVLRRTSMEAGLQYTITAIFGYVMVALGIYLAMTRLFDLSSFGTVVAALSVGIGFGLQEVISNFVSGLILLFERPLKVGDFVSVGGMDGVVQSINIRSSTIKTNDNTYLMVPNKEFIAQTVVNYRHRDPKYRVHVPVGVSYSADPQQVKEVLLGIAAEHQAVLDVPKPDVWFQSMGESSIDFALLVWIREPARSNAVKSELTFAIFKALGEANIEIPFPQRDLHIKSQPA
jgi:small-conductance mechanosensitive channel